MENKDKKNKLFFDLFSVVFFYLFILFFLYYSYSSSSPFSSSFSPSCIIHIPFHHPSPLLSLVYIPYILWFFLFTLYPYFFSHPLLNLSFSFRLLLLLIPNRHASISLSDTFYEFHVLSLLNLEFKITKGPQLEIKP